MNRILKNLLLILSLFIFSINSNVLAFHKKGNSQTKTKINNLINTNRINYVYVHTPIASNLIRIAKLFNLKRKPIIIFQVHGFRFYGKTFSIGKIILL